MSIILALVVTYVSLCTGQVVFNPNNRPAASSSTNNRQSSNPTETRLGLLATQLGVAPVPGQQNFPPNSGGGIFNQPGSFNPAGFPSSGGNGNLIQGSSFNRGCFCHPRNQKCPPGAVAVNRRRRDESVVRIANAGPGNECEGQQICCSDGASPINSPPEQGPGPIGPTI